MKRELTDTRYLKRHCDNCGTAQQVAGAFCYEAAKGSIEPEFAQAARRISPYGMDPAQMFGAIVALATELYEANQ